MHIVKRGRPFARLTAECGPLDAKGVPGVDLMARLREVWGDWMFSDAEVRAMREAGMEGTLTVLPGAGH